jgi:predicted kinase
VAAGAALIVMVGVPGAGKSVLAREVAAAVDADLIQTDAVRKGLFPRPRYTPKETRTVYAVSHRRLAAALRAGRRVIFDATNLQERTRTILYRIAERHAARLLVLVAYAPEPVIRARLARRGQRLDPHDLSDADWTIYLGMRRTAEPVGRPHVVANTCVSPGPVLRLLRRMLEGDERAPGHHLSTAVC